MLKRLVQVATAVYLDFACLSGVFSQDEPKSRGIGGPVYTGVGYFTGVSLCGCVCVCVRVGMVK